jgi:hypothetical protein
MRKNKHRFETLRILEMLYVCSTKFRSKRNLGFVKTECLNQKRSASALNLMRDRVSKESTLVSKVREDQILFNKISHQFLVTTKQSKHPFSNSIGEQHQTLGCMFRQAFKVNLF